MLSKHDILAINHFCPPPPPLKNKFFVTVSNTIGFIVLSDEH